MNPINGPGGPAGKSSPNPSPNSSLVADIGGTNARFALLQGGRPCHLQVLQTADYENLQAAIRFYLGATPGARPTSAAFAVASPVTGDAVRLTNRNWSFSIDELGKDLGFQSLAVVNDFAAVALSVPRLGPDEVEGIGGGRAADGAPVAVIGPGTGLGVSALVTVDGRTHPLATEGGHVTLAGCTEREGAVIDHLRRRFGHVSAERCISGPGLVNLYGALCALAGGEAARLTPADVTERALAGSDELCVEAAGMFCAMLGTEAGNLALSLGALGGVYIAGGIVPRLGRFFKASQFRARFEAKGRFATYNAAIPTFVITADQPAFTGLAALLED